MRTRSRIAGLILASLLPALSLLAPLAFSQTPSPSGLLIKEAQKVVFMGDSVTGMGWSDSGGYIHLVTSGLETLGIKIVPVPAGVGGNRSLEMVARLDRDVLSLEPDWLLLSCGVNDVWSRSIDLDTFKKNITSIVDRTQAAGIKVMILTPTPIYEANVSEFSTKLVDYVAFMCQLARERNLPLADINAAWLNDIKAQPPGNRNHVLTIDGVHPNPDGHLALAREVLHAFGATPDQMGKVEAGWMAAPDNATITIWENINNDALLTLRQFESLNKIAADRKMLPSALINSLHMEALLAAFEAIKTRGDFSKVHDSNVSEEAKPIFQKKLEALLR